MDPTGNAAALSLTLRKGVDVEAYTAELAKKVKAIPSKALFTVTNRNLAGDDYRLKVVLTGADPTALENQARIIKSKLQLVQGLSVEGAADNDDSHRQIRLLLDRDKIRQAGISADEILRRIGPYLTQGVLLSVRMNGVTVIPDKGTQSQTKLRQAGQSATVQDFARNGDLSTGNVPILLETDLMSAIAANQGMGGGIHTGTGSNTQTETGKGISAAAPGQEIVDAMAKETFIGKDGQPIRLNQLASLQTGNRLPVIRERDGRPFAQVSADIVAKDAEAVADGVKQMLKETPFPPGMTCSIGGISQQVAQMVLEVSIAIAASILLVLLIVSMFFRGWKAPLAVLACIPLALIGSVWGMLLMQKEWNLTAFVGLLMLTGIAVTNGIVLVDRIERNVGEGMRLENAVVKGAITRVRPILMTALTTILTLLPLLFADGGDAIVSQTLGIVVIGGMISSTLISLLVIPILYVRLHVRTVTERREKLEQLRMSV